MVIVSGWRTEVFRRSIVGRNVDVKIESARRQTKDALAPALFRTIRAFDHAGNELKMPKRMK